MKGDFKGTMTRSDFWFLYLYLLVLLAFTGIFFFSLSSFFDAQGVLSGFYIAVLLAQLCLPAANARRLHDVGKSGWWQLVPVYSLILFLMPSVSSNPSSTEANYDI